MTISKNIVTDYGAVGDGVTDNVAAFTNFRTFGRVQTDTVELTIPAGTFDSSQIFPFDGINSLVVNGSGATIIGALTFLTGHAGFSQKANRSARLYTIIEGATSAFCKTPSQAAFFTVDRIVAIGAQEYQGTFGYPPNFQKMQHVRVVSINSTTGEVVFTPAATETYYDHFIETSVGSYDTGGPVTMFVMRNPENGDGTLETGFDADVTVNGLAFETDSNQIYTRGLRFVGNDLTCTNCCLIPSNIQYCQYNRLTVTGEQMEVDKDVEYMELNDCNLYRIHVQSASVMRAVFNNVNTTNGWSGTARHTEIYGGSEPTGIIIGPDGYGASETLIIDGFDGPIDWIKTNKHDAADFTLSDGVLTYTGTGILPFGAEQSALLLAGQMTSNFRHVGYTRIITSAYDNGGGDASHDVELPTLAPSFLTGTVFVVQHPCRDVTLTNLTGGGEVYSDGPANKPLWSYVSDTQTFESEELLRVWGTISSIEIEVIRAYTGAQASCVLHLGGQNAHIPIIHADGVNGGFDFDWTINCKIAGLRTITPTTVTGNKTGDTSTPPGAIWLIEQVNPKVTTNISGDTSLQKPLIRVTVWTDQGIDPEPEPEPAVIVCSTPDPFTADDLANLRHHQEELRKATQRRSKNKREHQAKLRDVVEEVYDKLAGIAPAAAAKVAAVIPAKAKITETAASAEAQAPAIDWSKVTAAQIAKVIATMDAYAAQLAVEQRQQAIARADTARAQDEDDIETLLMAL